MEHWFDKIAKGIVIVWTTILPLATLLHNSPKKVPSNTFQIPSLETVTTTIQSISAPTSTPSRIPKSNSIKPTKKVLEKKAIQAKQSILEKIPAPSVTPTINDYEAKTSTTTSLLISHTKPWNEINADSKSSIINILCTSIFGGVFKPASGTGIIVSGNGLVLTAAHVGQFFLLKDYPVKDSVNCVARTGSPAKNEYELELVYLPPEWIAHNLNNITDENPVGTGEHDFALLKIVRRVNKESLELLPHPFPHLDLVAVNKIPEVGTTLLQSAYPAGFLGGVITNLALYNASALTRVNQLFTFSASSTIDLFGLDGTILAQKGSSGGAVITDTGKLAGVIVTSTVGTETSKRTLRAITIGHIDSTLFNKTGDHLAQILDEKDPTAFAKLSYEFNTYIAQQLIQALIKSIERK